MFSLERLRELGGKGNLQPSSIDRLLARGRRPLDRAFERSATSLGAMTALSKQVSEPAADAKLDGGGSPRILVASLRGWSTHNAYELVIAQALRLRGAQVALLTCGGGMPACELGWARRAHPRPCDRCAWLTDRVAGASGLRRYRLGDHMPWSTDARAAPTSPSAKTAASARQDSLVSVAWLLKASLLDRVADAQELAEDFAVAAEGVTYAIAEIFQEFEPEAVFLLNGLFGAERSIRRFALEHGVRAPTYETAPRAGALVFSQDTPAPDYDFDRLWDAVKDRPLNVWQRAEVRTLLEDRAHGIGAHESYYDRVEDDLGELRRRLSLRRGEHVVSLFTNVTWDSATLGRNVGFSSMFDWVEQAVRMAAERELVLVVRVHPAERRWGTREEVGEILLSRLGEIPANVRVVPAQDDLSSYALLDISDLLLTYTTTVGLEAAARGKQVAVAGATHYRGRGFTTDICGPEDLARALGQKPQQLPIEAVELAMRYAHMFFFRGMIPFGPVKAEGGKVKRLPREAEALAPGADPYLDWICERILDGGDFGLPDELARMSLSSVRTE
jgi:hypothetical protein